MMNSITVSRRLFLFTLFLCTSCLSVPALSADLVPLIERITPSIVAVGTVQKTRRPPNKLLGTGFAIGDGRTVVTNAHVLPISTDSEHREQLAVFSGRGRQPTIHQARVIETDRFHDLAVLKIDGPALPALQIDASETVKAGQPISFTGFPIGAVLGLYPVTHTGIISALTPIAIPAHNSRQLTANQIRYLKNPYEVLQLDATAYPGNSGSPLISIHSGKVIGIINSVLVKGTKENALKDPSAITYAIPAQHLLPLIK